MHRNNFPSHKCVLEKFVSTPSSLKGNLPNCRWPQVTHTMEYYVMTSTSVSLTKLLQYSVWLYSIDKLMTIGCAHVIYSIHTLKFTCLSKIINYMNEISRQWYKSYYTAKNLENEIFTFHTSTGFNLPSPLLEI